MAELAIYLVGVACVYYALLVGAISGYRGKLFAVISIIAIGVVAVFRGSVGTDTANYEQMAGMLRAPSDWYGVEPGFAVLVWFLGWFTDSDVVLVRLIAAMFVAGLLVFIRRADRDEMFFLTAYFIPAIFFQYSMNALRIGLATIFLLLALQYFRRARVPQAVLHVMAGWFFHYSLLISTIYLIVSARLLSARFLMALSVAGVVFLGLVLFLFADYIVPRILAYQGMEPPGALSGLSSLIVLSVLLAGAMASSLGSARRAGFVIITAVSVGGAFMLARYTYAGLRVLDLLSIAVPASLLVLHGREGRTLNWKTKLAFLFAGALGLASSMRGFLLSAGEGATPWVPYEWIF